jgi:hypothetical protein
VKTTMIKTIGLTSTAATCFGAPAVVLSGSGLAGRGGFDGFGGSDLSIANLPVAGAGLLAFHDERPMSAPVAAEAAAGHGFGYAAAGAGNHRSAMRQSDQQYPMWAFRGPGPWKARP